MPGESFRFIHASDFHLERPLGDLDQLPPHLRDALADAPRSAAAAVFDAATADNIDFLVLCGDLVNPSTAGPHAMALLLDGFEKLHAKKTPVFWSAGVADDPQRWPDAAPLPPNVTLFPKDRAIAVPVQRSGRTICHVIGRSSDGRSTLHVPGYRIDPVDEFTVAIGHGSAEAAALAEGHFDYWALGGRHNRQEIEQGANAAAVQCGTPQGRCLQETGPHGYCVVDVDSDQTTRVHQVECDTFRYCHEQIDAAEVIQVGTLKNLLGERIARLAHENGGRQLLIGWEINVATAEHLSAIGDPDETLRWLRREYGHGTPAAWSIALTVNPPRQFPKSWNDEDTILGDFLRATAKHRENDSRELNLLPFTEEHEIGQPGGLPTTTSSLLAEIAASDRGRLLDQATLLGVDLLRGGKPQLVQKS
ncbi:metallophosphoesterase family protein [Crateriforma conspicua]|uniref:Putative metallophosphoesterase YhaO n=1 Tax=Crateriforma conspicua TaxID=2527996 RepID=A0A5C5YC35_9PLAN|nr:metallophosphoesterase [Crateriforma conspicua]TWT71905.1 putative metallophosphoesterase YhaO [Crateriforma conspicua]